MGDEKRYTTLACGYLGIAAAQVMKTRIDEQTSELVIIWDAGKHKRIPLKLLDGMQMPEDDENFVTVDATDGAVRLMEKYHIDAADVLDLVGDKRLTVPDVRAYMKEGNQ